MLWGGRRGGQADSVAARYEVSSATGLCCPGRNERAGVESVRLCKPLQGVSVWIFLGVCV